MARRVLWAVAGALAGAQMARELQDAASLEAALQGLALGGDPGTLAKLCTLVHEPAAGAQVGTAAGSVHTTSETHAHFPGGAAAELAGASGGCMEQLQEAVAS